MIDVKVVPYSGRLLIKPIEVEEKFTMDIEEKKTKSGFAEIVKVASDVMVSPEYKYVLYSMYDGLPVNIEGEKYMILKEEEIAGLM